MSEIYAVVQCQNSGSVPEPGGTAVDVRAALAPMTNGFRIVFGRVFSQVVEMDDHPRSARWLDEDVRIEGVWVAHSGPGQLEGLERDCWVAVLRLAVDGDAQAARDRMNDARIARGAGMDRAVFDELAAALGECELTRLFGRLTFSVPDTKLTAVQPAAEAAQAMPLLVAFYYFGLMTVHRIDRDQVRTDMPIDTGVHNEEGAIAIARTRVRLTNVNRYFLTTNRSQYPAVRDVCRALAEGMSLESRYERQLAIHRDMERHLDNISQIAHVRSSQETQQASERTNSVLFYLTLIGLPLAAFSAVMTFSLDAPLVSQADRWPTWITFLVAFSASAAVSLLLLGVLLFVSSRRGRRRCDPADRPDGDESGA